MKMFRVTANVKSPVMDHDFVDWYNAETKEEALQLADEDAHRYGLPANVQFTVVEVDPETVNSPNG